MAEKYVRIALDVQYKASETVVRHAVRVTDGFKMGWNYITAQLLFPVVMDRLTDEVRLETFSILSISSFPSTNLSLFKLLTITLPHKILLDSG